MSFWQGGPLLTWGLLAVELIVFWMFAALRCASSNSFLARRFPLVHHWVIVRPLRRGVRVVKGLLTLGAPDDSDHQKTASSRCWDLAGKFTQVFYLLLTAGGYAGFAYEAFPLFEELPQIPTWHRWSTLLTMLLCLLQYTHLCTSDPGYLQSKEAAEKYARLFAGTGPEKKPCRTCRQPRPARSRHCRMCGFCCVKYDHHCIWFRRCIGLHNWRFFVLFCLSHVFMAIYGVTLIASYLLAVVEHRGLRTHGFVWADDPVGAAPQYSTWLVYAYLTTRYPISVACLVLLAAVGISLTLFVIYQVANHWLRGRTTIEDNIIVEGKLTWARFREAVVQDIFPETWIRSKLSQR